MPADDEMIEPAAVDPAEAVDAVDTHRATLECGRSHDTHLQAQATRRVVDAGAFGCGIKGAAGVVG